VSLTLLLNTQVVTNMAITLTWNANIEPDLAGYKVHRGSSPGVYSTIVDVGIALTYQVTLGSGTYYFAVTAYDTSNNQSAFSNEVSTTVDLTPPAAPTGLQAVMS